MGQTDPVADVVLESDGQTVTADTAGVFTFSNISVGLGTNPLTTVVTDTAGNEGRFTLSIARVELEDTFTLAEGDDFVVERSTLIELGQSEGSRTLSFDIDAQFDTTDQASALEDLFLVYLRDPDNPGQTLLDRGTPGTALFSLAGGQADYPSGLVTFDGTTVQVDLTSLANQASGLLVFQLINSDTDSTSQVTVASITNTLDEEGAQNPVFPTPLLFAPSTTTLDLTGLNPTTAIDTQFTNVRLDSELGRYTVELSLKNNGAGIGRNAAVVFPGLPEGVQLINATGLDASGDSYVNLESVIQSGGLAGGAQTGVMELIFDNPGLVRFSLIPQVLVGGPNQAPTFDPVGSLTVTPGDRLEVQLNATDPDGDVVIYSITSNDPLPTGMLEGKGNLVFNPIPADVGNYNFTLTASDGVLLVSQNVTLDVVADSVTTTRVSGVVQDTNQQPLAGVPVEIGTLMAVTADDGSFTLDLGSAGPLPDDTLKIRGEQITGSQVYPFIAEKLDLMLGHVPFDGFNNVISRPIYLPALDVASGVTIDPVQDVMVTTAAILGAEVFVAAGTLEDQNGGMFTGQLSITEVPVNLTPAALPANLFPDLVVTIQPGEMVFTTPAPLSLPNNSGFDPGTMMNLWSINPTTGQFEIVGAGQVSVDGSTIETVSGGINNSSWHFFIPFIIGSLQPIIDNLLNPNDEGGDDHGSETADATSQVLLHSGALVETHELVTYQSLGQSRGPALNYDSQRVDLRPVVHFGFDSVIGMNANDRLISKLTINRSGFQQQVPGHPGGQFGLTGGENLWKVPGSVGGRVKDVDAALQIDLRTQPSGRYNYTLDTGLRRFNGSNFTGTSSTQQGQLLIVNSIASPFGAGWGLTGLQQIVENPGGSILLIDGDGSDWLFEPPTTPGGCIPVARG